MLKHLGRGIGGRLELHPVESYDQYGTEMPKHDSEPDDVFDCVNKPEYDCRESVGRAGARCSKCRVRRTEGFVCEAQSNCYFWRNI